MVGLGIKETTKIVLLTRLSKKVTSESQWCRDEYERWWLSIERGLRRRKKFTSEEKIL